MSEIKTNKISPRTDNGTVTIGDAGDSIDFSGADKLRVPTSASAPSSPSAGDMYYNTTDNIVFYILWIILECCRIFIKNMSESNPQIRPKKIKYDFSKHFTNTN